MPNQADFDRVMRCIIDPIKRHYAAELLPETIDDFIAALAKYSEQTLRDAMPVILEENKRRPTLAHVIEACKKSIPKSSGAVDPSRKYPWQEREEQRQKLVGDYVARFKLISTTWAEAEREGWDLELERYIRAVAHVQAQMILGEKNIGWDGMVIFGATAVITDELRRGFLSDQRRQAEMGHIDVGLPIGRISDWKAARQWRREQDALRPSAPSRVAKTLNPGIDQYLLEKMSA